MKNYFFVSVVGLILGTSLSYCSDKDAVYEEIKMGIPSEEAILSFSTKDKLGTTINELLNVNETKSLIKNLSEIELLPKGQSLFEQENYKEFMSEFVPNIQFAKLLNRNGEIIVENKIYKITPNGTYYFDEGKKNEFYALYKEDNEIKGELVGDKLYKIAEGIYRYDTFYKEEGEINEGKKLSASEVLMTKSGHSTGTDPNIEIMDWFTADRTTKLGKIIQNMFGATKEFAKYYPHTDNRRVKGSFYFYNYVTYAEIGVQGWTDKKNWIGWSKTASDELRVGWNNVVLVTKIPDNYSNSMKAMNNLSRSVSPVQYMDVPGTMHKVNLKTMVIPDFDATNFDKVLTIGAKPAFDWLKSLSSQNQSDWERAEAVLVISRTHIFTFFRNQEVRNVGVESYTHIFASQVKFMISLNLSSFPQSVSSYANVLLDVVKNSSKLAYPTLANGDVFVAAKFNPYWQGMRIKKRTSEVISTMNLK